MADGQIWYIAAGSIGVVFWSWLFQKSDAYLARRRSETGRGLAERIGYRLGKLWPGRKRVGQ
jgi:hypothetical protein